jgi:hypothetical protein
MSDKITRAEKNRSKANAITWLRDFHDRGSKFIVQQIDAKATHSGHSSYLRVLVLNNGDLFDVTRTAATVTESRYAERMACISVGGYGFNKQGWLRDLLAMALFPGDENMLRAQSI